MSEQFDKKYIFRVIAVFCIGWAVIYADRTAMFPMLNVIGEEFKLTSAQTGLFTSAYFLMYVLMQIPAGAWGDKYGLKKVLVVMYFIAGVGMLMVGLFAHNYVTLMAFIAIHGLGAGAYYPGAYGTTLNTVPKEMRGLSTAIINSGMSIGLAIGLAAAGPIYLFFDNWKMPFLVLAIPTILVALLYQVTLKDIRPPQIDKGTLKDVLGNKNLMLINGAIFCSLYGFWTIMTWGPTFLMQEKGLSLTASGLYTAIVAVTAIPAGLTIGKSSDKTGRKKLSLILLPCAAVTIFMMANVNSMALMVLALVLYGVVGKLTWDPVAVSWTGDHISKIKPQAMGTAVAVFNFCGMCSSIIAPIICGWLNDITGSLVPSFYLGAAIVLLGTVFIAFVEETVVKN